MKGGCHCGAIRYKALDKPFAADFCHCRDCQKTSGAPVGAWMDFKSNQIRWLSGKTKEYASSEKTRRGFCSVCGSILVYRSTDHPGYITLSIATLDYPDSVKPTYHIYTDSQVKWLVIEDNCKKFPQGK